MKIALIGTHSTGKTTIALKLALALKERDITIAMVDEIARICPLPINEETSLESQIWILQKQIKEENRRHKDDEILICDRATLDNFAYMQRAAKTENISEYEKIAADHMNNYDFVFKTTKLNKPARIDGVRSVDQEFRDDIDDRITDLLKKHSITYYNLPGIKDDTMHIAFMLDTLEKYKVITK